MFCLVSSAQDDSSLSSEEEAEMSEPTWLAADLGAASDLSPPSRGERMRHSPQNTHIKEDDGKEPQSDLLVFSCCPRRMKGTASCCSGGEPLCRINVEVLRAAA